MRTIALIIAIAILATAFVGHWVLSILLYILMGIVWAKHELGRPFAYAPMGRSTAMGTFLLFILWPLIVIYDCYESWRIISKGKRFITHDGVCLREFPDWNSALECARKRAKESNEREMISDQTIFTKQLGRIQTKSWFIHSDGKIEKLSRAGL